LDHIGIGNNFVNEIPVARQLRESIDKWDFMKLKKLYTAKEAVTRLKRQPIEWEIINQNIHGSQDTNLPKNQQSTV
jgi:hypothetical protein